MDQPEPASHELQSPLQDALRRCRSRVFWLSSALGVMTCALVAVIVIAVSARPPTLDADSTPDECVEASSAILYCTHELGEQILTTRVQRILLLRPGVTVHYAVGDCLGEEPRMPGATYGEGAIAFFAGNPAKFRRSYTVIRGRIGSFADMPLDLFLAKVDAANQRIHESDQ